MRRLGRERIDEVSLHFASVRFTEKEFIEREQSREGQPGESCASFPKEFPARAMAEVASGRRCF
jgi:hypothetical protein